MKFIKYIIKSTISGYKFLLDELCNGFFTIISFLFSILYIVFRLSLFDHLSLYFKKKEKNVYFYVFTQLLIISLVIFINCFYVPNQKTVSLQRTINKDNENHISEFKNTISNGFEDTTNKTYLNLFQYYGSLDYSIIDLESMKSNNPDIVVYLTVDGTNINYPIVQTNNNDYYLNNDINKNYSLNGWPFMDFRNNSEMSDQNTIFYGHNLLNKTSFGSLKNIFSIKWFNDSTHQIIVTSSDYYYIYNIFSIYESDASVDYLMVDFYNNEFEQFIINLKSKSIFDFNIDVSNDDKIITLSTCSDDSNKRRVVHAKLMNIINK